MNLPSLPTDSLYKFIAFRGIYLIPKLIKQQSQSKNIYKKRII
jgi:hypothetical protein